MDAVKFIKEDARMCDKYDNCNNCPVSDTYNGYNLGCEELKNNFTEQYIAIVEKWSSEHPIKTRQSEFLKMFPNADFTNEGILNICPRRIDLNSVTKERCNNNCLCTECKKEYWLAEVE